MFIYMSKIILGLILILVFQSSMASPAKMESVKELLQLLNIKNTIEIELNELQPSIDRSAERLLLKQLNKEKLSTVEEHLAVVQIGQVFRNTTEQFFQSPATMEQIENIYAQNLTQEEILFYIHFLKTPEGFNIHKKLSKVNPQVLKYLNLMNRQEWMNYMQLEQFQEKINKIIEPLVEK